MRGNFLCRTIFRVTHQLNFVRNQSPPLLSLISLRYISSTAKNQDSFTVSYLINTCGLSPDSALSASKIVHFETPENPNSVINFFKNHGFSQTQISETIRKEPRLLVSEPLEKTLLPTFEFFYSKGMSNDDLAKILSINPGILSTSSDDSIITTFNFIKSILQSDENTIACLKRCPYVIRYDVEARLAPNIKFLRFSGVPESNICKLLLTHPITFLIESDLVTDIVKILKDMELNPLKFHFLQAMHVMGTMSISMWQRKIDIYKKWGWSEKQTLEAFGKHPFCMSMSESKIMAVMDFFVNKMGLKSSTLARSPALVCYSLEKRIVPRCSVIQVLLSKGLIKKVSYGTALLWSEKLFLQKYVTCYEKKAPELLKLYEEKMTAGLGEPNLRQSEEM